MPPKSMASCGPTDVEGPEGASAEMEEAWLSALIGAESASFIVEEWVEATLSSDGAGVCGPDCSAVGARDTELSVAAVAV